MFAAQKRTARPAEGARSVGRGPDVTEVPMAGNRALRSVPGCTPGAQQGEQQGAQQVHTPDVLFSADTPARPARRLKTADARRAMERAYRDGLSLAEGAALATRSRSRVKAVYDELKAAEAAEAPGEPETVAGPAEGPADPPSPVVVFIGRCGPNPPVHSGWWNLKEAQDVVEGIARAKYGITARWENMGKQGYPQLWTYQTDKHLFGTVERVVIGGRN